MKVVLVLDMPEDCLACPCFSVIGSEHCSITMKEVGLHIPMWCPLRPLPQKRINKDCLVVHEIWNEGWNTCLDEITGETE